VPRHEPKQRILFETYLCQVGAVKAYTKNIRELCRMIAPGDRDLARAIDKNAKLVQRKAKEAIATHSELAECVGYKYLRPPSERPE